MSQGGEFAGRKLMRKILWCSLALGMACNPGPLQADASEADAGKDATDGGAVDAGPPLWPVGATHVLATRRGGFPTPYCATDAGTVEGSTYDLTLPAGRLQFRVCHGYPPNTLFVEGDLTLDAGQVAQFDDAMQTLTRSDRRSMWADAAVMVLLLTTPAGPVRYEADFYATQQRPDPTTWVPWEQVEPVFVLLDAFAGIR